MKKSIVLLSGGLDSATCLYWAKSKGYQLYALSFDYGQRHRKELDSAKKCATHVGAILKNVKFTLPWGESSLLDSRIQLPKKRSIKKMTSGIPSTYVPARNTVFLSFALSYADAIKADAIIIGANSIDYSGYPDCRPNYLKAMQRVSQLGTRQGVQHHPIKILSPLLHLSKAQIIRLGFQLKVPYQHTWSCYSGGKKICSECDSCQLRAKGFEESGHIDPLALQQS